ncbi:hypothetical protein ASC64_06435 [Nocardioides sp. Root122]|uniref:hypothetical protein n=1 Tax=Nocardioides TaxID=1839 RepID=UPI000702E637|nr:MULTISPECIES: hypothetical protein [Nocardioides]KQV69481.1 hypothetical protein ASC64_06435 [Nocardioides sp. Root122]MCK9824257.1 hypothetical protein [Nocardioides cavernae]
MGSDLLDLDADGLLAAATEAEAASRLAEVHKLELLSAWAVLHSTDPTEGPDGHMARRVGNVLRQVGGDGTPGVQDFCLGEIALARGAGVTATSNMLADVLDLEHRLPLTWAVTRRGECEVWVARRVARLSRHLPADKVGVVDSAVSRMIASESVGRVLEVAEAKVIEADTALHEERCEAERRRRYVGPGRTDEFGLRTLIARLEAGDAAAVDAIVHRVGEIIAPRHPDDTPDELRALAFGWLARPAELFALLVEHSMSANDPDADALFDEPEPESQAPSRAFAFPADLLDALRDLDLRPLAPKVVLHVHLHEAALHSGDGVARIEGFGPVTIARLAELLRGSIIKIQPVKDLSNRVRYTAYEHPESLRDQVHLVTGGDYWPWAGSTSRKVDLDHPVPYDHGDETRDPPPDQTGSHNSGPLGRRHHRWKTHAGYRSRQCGEGRYVWLTPHGQGFLVDHTGTHRIHPEKARMILDAPVGVDIYPA